VQVQAGMQTLSLQMHMSMQTRIHTVATVQL